MNNTAPNGSSTSTQTKIVGESRGGTNSVEFAPAFKNPNRKISTKSPLNQRKPSHNKFTSHLQDDNSPQNQFSNKFALPNQQKAQSDNLFTQTKRKFRATKTTREHKRDYYEVLGVSKNADEAEIKKSYFALAKKYHPDMSKEPDAQKKFAEVAAAYECLGNAEKRKQYDQFGQT